RMLASSYIFNCQIIHFLLAKYKYESKEFVTIIVFIGNYKNKVRMNTLAFNERSLPAGKLLS
ncbi:hypothetical protein, partial [Halalkalibacter oceani]|uniref:hypothetical protein n=1 Tax=Halalkalibacter oceani TaxID=1653776 RepID=UPI0035F3238B